jgi:hypothetical protein
MPGNPVQPTRLPDRSAASVYAALRAFWIVPKPKHVLSNISFLAGYGAGYRQGLEDAGLRASDNSEPSENHGSENGEA